MNSYNGYSGAQRLKALAWIKKEWANGTRPAKPCSCDGCGQTEGLLMWHSEDYSAPFGDNIGRFGLCYTCHMMIHCRYRNKKAWDIYKKAIEQGYQFKPYFFNDWNSFRRDCLINHFVDRPCEKKSQHKSGLLTNIEKGVYANEDSAAYKALVGSELAL